MPDIESVTPQNTPQQRSMREILVGGIGIMVFLTVVAFGINAIGTDTIRQFIEDAGPWGPLAYIALKAVTYVFAPLTSGPIQLLAGTLFGNVWLGVLYTLIGEVIGGSVSFWIARYFGRPVVARVVGNEGMQQVEHFYKNRMGGWVSLAVARVLLFSVWDFLSYAAGLAESIRYRTYALVSIIFGFFPTFLFVYLGERAFEDNTTLILIYGLVAALVLIPVLARRQIEAVFEWASGQDNKNQKAKRDTETGDTKDA